MSRGKERDDYGPASTGVRNKVSVLVRNIPLNFTAEDLRAKFEKFGELRDVYIPRDYYTSRSRGFGFIEFRDARDADEAIYQCDRTMLDGREINVCLSKEGRKTPREMMVLEVQPTDGRSGGSDSDRRDRRRSRSPRRGSRYSRSRSPRGRSGRSSRSPRGRGGRDYDRERDRNYDRDARDRDDGRGYGRDGRMGGGGSDRDRERDRERGPVRERDYEPRSRSRSPPRVERERERDRSPTRGRDASPRSERPAGFREEKPVEEARPDDTVQPVHDDYY